MELVEAYWRDALTAFGTLASIIGAVLTVMYARGAKAAADAAKDAAANTRVRIANVDVFSALKDLLGVVREIGFRLEEGSIAHAREKAEDARMAAVELLETNSFGLSEKKQELLSIFVVQMKELHETLGRNREGSRSVDARRVRDVLSDQREALTVIKQRSESGCRRKSVVEVPDTTRELWRALTDRIIFATSYDKLKWQKTSDETTFLTSVGKSVVAFSIIEPEREHGHPDFEIKVLSKSGEVLDRFMDLDLDKGLSPAKYYQELSDLYRRIYRKETGADEAIKELIGELPDPDDIPF